MFTGSVEDALAKLGITKPEPIAWIVPGSENARDNGAMDAWAWQWGEFSMPVYSHDDILAMRDTRIAALETKVAALHTDCHTLKMAAADANTLVLSHEAHIDRLTSFARDCYAAYCGQCAMDTDTRIDAVARALDLTKG